MNIEKIGHANFTNYQKLHKNEQMFLVLSKSEFTFTI